MSQFAFAAAACQLAKSIYYARMEAFGLEGKHWEALDIQTKQTYVRRAQDLLEGLRPQTDYLAFAAKLAREHGKVIATISPDAPWGEPS